MHKLNFLLNNNSDIFKKIFEKNYILYLILLLSFLVRFINSYKLGYDGDEILTFWITEPRISTSELKKRILENHEYVPNFYYQTLKFYNQLSGYSANAVRLFHIFFNLSSIVVFYYICRLFLSSYSTNIALYFVAFNNFLIECSNQVRVVSFSLFFQLLSIYFFFKVIDNLNKKKIFYSIFLILFNYLAMSTVPMSILIVISQLLLVIILFSIKLNKKKLDTTIQWINNTATKDFLIFFALIFFSILLYFFINYDYLFNILLSSKFIKLANITIRTYIGWNFNIYFSNIFLGFFYFLIVLLFLKNIKKFLFTNIYILYLLIIFIVTYFVLFVSGYYLHVNSPRYWAYLVPIIIIFIVFYTEKESSNFFLKLFFLIILICTPVISYLNKDKYIVPKTETFLLLEMINSSNTDTIVRPNLSYFDFLLIRGYEQFDKNIINLKYYKLLNKDFWYLCVLDNPFDFVEKKAEHSNCYIKDLDNKFEKEKTVKMLGLTLVYYKIK